MLNIVHGLMSEEPNSRESDTNQVQILTIYEKNVYTFSKHFCFVCIICYSWSSVERLREVRLRVLKHISMR